MPELKNQYIFPEPERKIFVNGGRMLLPIELIMHGMFLGSSIYHQDTDGVWISLLLALLFGGVHYQNLQLRKYCLAKWSFNGTTFAVDVKDMRHAIDVNQPFCVSSTVLTFARRYSPAKYPFIMIWKPGANVPFVEMGAYKALKKRDALIIPYNAETAALFREFLNLQEIPSWPKSHVFYGNSR